MVLFWNSHKWLQLFGCEEKCHGVHRIFSQPCSRILRIDITIQINHALLAISCSSTCFGHLYAHHQERRLQVLSQATSFSQCTHLATRLSGTTTATARTEHHRQWLAVCCPDDGRKDARNMLRNNWLPINHHLLHLVVSPLFAYLRCTDIRT